MEITAIAQTLAALLAPALPYLLKAGESAASKIGEDAWEKAKTLWGKLSAKIKAKPSAQEAVEDVAKAPADDDAQAALRVQLKKLLLDDTSLAKELEQLLSAWQKSGNLAMAAGERSVAAGGDVKGSTIVTGDQNLVRSKSKE